MKTYDKDSFLRDAWRSTCVESMVRYTIEELLQLKPSEAINANFNSEEFGAMIEKVKQLQALKEEEFLAHNGGHFNRRRSSHHHGKPKIKHTKPKVTTDSDGWSTFEAKKKGSGDEEEEEAVKEAAPVQIAQETLKVKPNKNISSSRPADSKDIVTDKPTLSFNAFAALESEEEDDEE